MLPSAMIPSSPDVATVSMPATISSKFISDFFTGSGRRGKAPSRRFAVRLGIAMDSLTYGTGLADSRSYKHCSFHPRALGPQNDLLCGEEGDARRTSKEELGVE